MDSNHFVPCNLNFSLRRCIAERNTDEWRDQFLEKCFVAPVGERNAKFWYYQMSCKRLFTGRWVTPATWGNQLMWGNPPISFQVEHVYMTGGVIISEIIWTGGLPHLNGLRHLPVVLLPPCKQTLTVDSVTIVGRWRSWGFDWYPFVRAKHQLFYLPMAANLPRLIKPNIFNIQVMFKIWHNYFW